MFLSTIAAKNSAPPEFSPLMKAVRDGLPIHESSIVFSVSPLSCSESGETTTIPSNSLMRNQTRSFNVEGDVFVVKTGTLDIALWKIGGAAVALRLVQIANVSTRSLS